MTPVTMTRIINSVTAQFLRCDLKMLCVRSGPISVKFCSIWIMPHATPQYSKYNRRIVYAQLPHPPYSPDLAPPDSYLHGELKDKLRGMFLKVRVKSVLLYLSASVRKATETSRMCMSSGSADIRSAYERMDNN